MKSKSVFLKRLPKQILQYAILLFGRILCAGSHCQLRDYRIQDR